MRKFTIDWQLTQLVVGFGQGCLVYGVSPIPEIEIIEQGQCAEVGDGRCKKRALWNPADIARIEREEPHDALVAMLRSSIKGCVHAWASSHDSILLRLSGGLDSSIVLHCLIDAPNRPRVTCVNHFWRDKRSDERHAARIAASNAGVHLVEHEFGTAGSLEVIDKVECTLAPLIDIVEWQESDRQRQLAASVKASAIFMGSLGDGIFQLDPGPACVADYIRRRGFRPEILRIAHDVALNQRISVWEVIAEVARSLWRSRSRSMWAFPNSLIERGVYKSGNALVSEPQFEQLLALSLEHTHPWLTEVQGVPECKLPQIHSLTIDKFYDAPFRGLMDAPIIPPFFSQPLVELCLQTPTHHSVRRGVDRSLAREAFADILPKGILRRRGKGSPGSWLAAVIEEQADFVREYLLSGVLVREQVVDKSRLEEALPGRVSTIASQAGSVMNLLYTEAWLRAWERSGSAKLRMP